MKKVYHLDAWKADKKLPAEKQTVSVRIRFKYIDEKKVANLRPEERVVAIDKYFQDSYAKLLKAKLLLSHKVTGRKRRPREVDAVLLYDHLERLARFRFVESVSVNAGKVRKAAATETGDRFFCIRMTVVIEIEEAKVGSMQLYDDRFMLIKAKSIDAAYAKMERQKKEYVKPYLNPEGHFVRWRIESLDDCFVTDITDSADLDSSEGVEVFSVLKKRKLTKERYWDGKSV